MKRHYYCYIFFIYIPLGLNYSFEATALYYYYYLFILNSLHIKQFKCEYAIDMPNYGMIKSWEVPPPPPVKLFPTNISKAKSHYMGLLKNHKEKNQLTTYLVIFPN